MEQNPKQQTTELIRQAQKILLVTGRELNNDQLCSLYVAQNMLTKLGKEALPVISDNLPKAKDIVDTSKIAKDITGIQDFVISLNLANVEIDKLKYDVEDGHLNISVTPKKGNFTSKDATFSYGDYNFDLVLCFGVTNIDKIDRILEDNPTLFDGLHLVNIDYHRVNSNFGSVNLVDHSSGSVCEIMVSLVESLGQELMDNKIATALLAGIMASTNRFTAENTTPKCLSIAAQMLAAKADRSKIVKILYNGQYDKRRHNNQDSKQQSQLSQKDSQVTQPNKSVGPFKGKIEGKKDLAKTETKNEK